MCDYQVEYDKLRASFELTWALYVDTCEDLLGPLDPPPQELRKLLHDPVYVEWADLLLRKKLETRLGRSYDSYLYLTKQLEIKIIKLRELLKLEDTVMLRWATEAGDRLEIDEDEKARFFQSAKRRIFGAFNVDKCDKLMVEIDRDVIALGELIGNVSKFERPRRVRQLRNNSNYCISLRDNAQEIYKSLASACAWLLSCGHQHRASIQLERKTKEWGSAQPDLGFRFIVP